MDKLPSHCATEWKEFKRALTKSPDFNPFAWIFKLVFAACQDVCELTGFRWRPIIPIFGVFLVLAVSSSYTWKLRAELLRLRWCDDTAATCSWMHLHDFLVFYFTVMIIFHYVRASSLSPGILITKQMKRESCRSGPTSIDIGAEQRRLDLYGPLRLDEINALKSKGKTLPSTIQYHPSANPTFCDKCDMIRPPRCHHCRVCNRCVLQFDHHCVWLNNCIGYNNVRSFVLVLVYITAACWYGVLLLYKPFYGPLQEQIRQQGGMWKYMSLSTTTTNEKGLFDFPSWTNLIDMIFSSDESFPVQVVVDLIFPFLLGVGGILAVFLGTHVKYVLSAVTTLEHRVDLARKYELFLAKVSSKGLPSEESCVNWVNPFDQGIFHRNWTQIMGCSWLGFFLPIAVAPPPPYIPDLSKKEH